MINKEELKCKFLYIKIMSLDEWNVVYICWIKFVYIFMNIYVLEEYVWYI